MNAALEERFLNARRTTPITESAAVNTATPAARAVRKRDTSDEAYVIDLCDSILGECALRQHRFAWLRGDEGRTGSRALPVDAYYPSAGVVVEYREIQHDGGVPFFDRRATLSGVGRGEQRRIYDERRDQLIPGEGLRLVVIKPTDLDSDRRGRLVRSLSADKEAVEKLLSACP